MKPKTICFLPAKGSSSRILNKNTQKIDGIPMFLYTLEKLMRCSFIDEVVLDTDSDSIIEMSRDTNCKIFKRDESLANNEADGNAIFMNEVNNHLHGDIFIQILCTSPFIKTDTIKKGIDFLCSNSSYCMDYPAFYHDSCVLTKTSKAYTWSNNKPNYNIDKIPNSVDLPKTTIETMGLYIITKEAALKTKRRIGESPYLIEAEPIEAIDIDWPEDLELADLIARGIRERNKNVH
jgi:CMP-N-acetylneuraminic acid synthetase